MVRHEDKKERTPSKVTLTQESAHFIPTEFSESFFKQFNLAMKIKREELKKQGKSSTQVNEITKGDMIQAFGVTKDQMQKADYQKGMDQKATITVQRRKYYSYNQGIQKVLHSKSR